MKGKLIVIEGLDGSGKATQTGLLYRALEKSGTAVRKISFPDYSSDSSALVKMYLNGEFGSDPDWSMPTRRLRFTQLTATPHTKRTGAASTRRGALYLPTATRPPTRYTSAVSSRRNGGMNT